jgi:hypothetical protein
MSSLLESLYKRAASCTRLREMRTQLKRAILQAGYTPGLPPLKKSTMNDPRTLQDLINGLALCTNGTQQAAALLSKARTLATEEPVPPHLFTMGSGGCPLGYTGATTAMFPADDNSRPTLLGAGLPPGHGLLQLTGSPKAAGIGSGAPPFDAVAQEREKVIENQRAQVRKLCEENNAMCIELNALKAGTVPAEIEGLRRRARNAEDLARSKQDVISRQTHRIGVLSDENAKLRNDDTPNNGVARANVKLQSRIHELETALTKEAGRVHQLERARNGNQVTENMRRPRIILNLEAQVKGYRQANEALRKENAELRVRHEAERNTTHTVCEYSKEQNARVADLANNLAAARDDATRLASAYKESQGCLNEMMRSRQILADGMVCMADNIKSILHNENLKQP